MLFGPSLCRYTYRAITQHGSRGLKRGRFLFWKYQENKGQTYLVAKKILDKMLVNRTKGYTVRMCNDRVLVCFFFFPSRNGRTTEQSGNN